MALRCPSTVIAILSGLLLAAASGLLGCSDSGSVAPGPGAPAPAAATAEPTDDSPVVATVGGQTITLDELDDFIKDTLLNRQTQNGKPVPLFELRQDYLNQILGRTVVEQMATAKGLSLADFVEQTRLELPPVTDAEVEAYYAENRDRLRHDAGLERLREGMRANIEQERLQAAIHQMVASATPNITLEPPRVVVGEEGHSRGPEAAPVTIVEFSDYRCPFCLKAEDTVQALLQRYPNEVRYVYRHRPRPSDGLAYDASVSAICAGEQGRFWEYHDQVFAHQAELTPELLASLAIDVGLEPEAFEQCRKAPEAAQRVALDAAEAGNIGVNSTPAFLINGVYLRGARPIEEFDRIIQSELKAGESG